MPCGDTICNNCYSELISQRKESFECPLCKEIHVISIKKVFPRNKAILKILENQPIEIERGNLVKEFKKNLNMISQKISKYELVWMD